MNLLSDCRCPACGGSHLHVRAESYDPTAIYIGAIQCRDCDSSYDLIWGTPFLGHYEEDEVLGLLEIAHNARHDNTYASRATVEQLESLLQGYHEATDKTAFKATSADEMARASWFDHRYNEWREFSELSEGINFSGLEVLDVGGGTGHDAVRLVNAGAHVTVLEYNPVLIQRGKTVVPEARWIGGFSHLIPFRAGTFDVVCANAALHHMRDVRAAVAEMLRVLRPGRVLLTTGDPFRADHQGDDVELVVFNSHTSVLLGVNEKIPRFGDIVDPVTAHDQTLDVTLRTNTLYDFKGADGRPTTITEPRWWTLTDKEVLRQCSGGLSMKAVVRERIEIPVTRQARFDMRAGAYAASLKEHESALRLLTNLIPARYVDASFPVTAHDKFQLMNGWQRPEGASCSAYRRARWFLTRPSDASTLAVELKAHQAVKSSPELEIQVDGRPVAFRMMAANPVLKLAERLLHALWETSVFKMELSKSRWTTIQVPVGHIEPGTRFIFEMRLNPDKNPESVPFEHNLFSVRTRCWL